MNSKSDIAIKVEGVSKTFKIPHEKVTSIRGAAVGLFSRKRGYEEFKALDDVSFEVKKGEFFGIIGRNGSGKSTLLKILAGIYQPDSGKIKIDGMISPFLELGIGFNPELSGRDNVYLNATVLGMTKKQIDEKFDSIVKFSELERFIDQKLKNYSSGMQVRLAFSVAIHANRDILLMDEVLAVGDSNFQSKCLTEFNRYKEMGKTVVLVSHDINTIQRFCDRAILLRSGKLIKIGNSEEVVDEYMCNNISDEESRMILENNDDEIGAGEKVEKKAVITKVKFLDSNGVERGVFQTGSDIIVRAYFKRIANIDNLNFGVGIYNTDGCGIFGISTAFDKIDTKKIMSDGYCEVLYKDVKIRTGSYFLKIVIMDATDTIVLDFLERSNIFKIVSKNKNTGIIDMNYSWLNTE